MASTADRVALIRLCQDVGFTLAETGRLLAATSWRREAWDQLAEHEIAELDARIIGAQRAKKLIQHALDCPQPDLLLPELPLSPHGSTQDPRSMTPVVHGRFGQPARLGIGGFWRSAQQQVAHQLDRFLES